MSFVFVLGAGGMGREIAAVAEANGDEVCFLDDGSPFVFPGMRLDGAPERSVVLRAQLPLARYIAGTGIPGINRRLVARMEALGALYAHTVRDRHAWIAPRAIVDPGCYFAPGARVSPDVALGPHVKVGCNATIGHDTVVGSFTTICPLAAISGRCYIGESVFIGAGATIREGVTVGNGATIGMGAVVLKDVAAGTTVVGNPARRLLKAAAPQGAL